MSPSPSFSPSPFFSFEMCSKQGKCYVNSQGKANSVKELVLLGLVLFFYYSSFPYKHVVEITELHFSSLIYDTAEN